MLQSLSGEYFDSGSITNNLFGYSYVGLAVQINRSTSCKCIAMLMIMITGRDHFTQPAYSAGIGGTGIYSLVTVLHHSVRSDSEDNYNYYLNKYYTIPFSRTGHNEV